MPQADSTRYLVFRERAGKYILVGDFVAPDSELVLAVQDTADGLAYSHPRGPATIRKPLGP